MKLETLALSLAALSLAACVHVPRVAPEARWGLARTRSTVQVDVSCGNIVVGGSSSGTGVIVSERHVLTAAHVVQCPAIPTVHVTYLNHDGPRKIRMVVTREDSTADIARLEIASAERFKLGIAPPIVRAPDPGVDVCAELALENRPTFTCGVVASAWTVAKNMETRSGDSGAPVFSESGDLVGLVMSSGESSVGRPYTRLATLDDSWVSDLIPVDETPESPWRLTRPPATASN